MPSLRRKAPKEPERFFPWLKTESEKLWRHAELNDEVYGYQIQAGTRWLSGLSIREITAYEEEMGFSFPDVYRVFLSSMNGTDQPGINIYGRSGEPYRYAPVFYSYPRDIKAVKAMIARVFKAFNTSQSRAEKRGTPHIVPITGHRFLVMDRCDGNPVLSMYEDDVVAYAETLPKFLFAHIFQNGQPQPKMPALKVKFWLDQPTAGN